MRLLRAARAIAGFTLALILIATWLAARPHGALSRRWTRTIWRAILRGFALDVHVRGTPLATPGTLYIANHLSWSDIAVLGALLDAGFVAKSEVATWPLIGPGARAYGCVFVQRDRRQTVSAQTEDIATRLSAGQSLILFAEGTTGDGSTVLPFRSSLFAGLSQGPVQPITLACRNRDGRPFTAAERRRFAWLDEDELLPHAAALALAGGARVDVFFDQPVSGADRKAVASACHAAISARLQTEL